MVCFLPNLKGSCKFPTLYDQSGCCVVVVVVYFERLVHSICTSPCYNVCIVIQFVCN